MERYQYLFNVHVEHSYFSDNLCKNLEFVPTNNSVKIMNNAGLIYNNRGHRLNILANQNNIDSLMLFARDIDEPFELQFKVYSSDVDFFNYTQCPIANEQAIVYYQQLVSGKEEQNDVIQASVLRSSVQLVTAIISTLPVLSSICQ